MLNLLESGGGRDCSGATRRDFLSVSALGLSALLSRASATSHPVFKDKSVVLLFLCGGASHIETFDPKMTAPEGFRSVTGEIKTSIPGVTFGSTYTGLAKRAKKLAVVRSFAPHQISDHAKAIRKVLTGGNSAFTSIGSRFARFRGTADSKTGMPTYCTLIQDHEPYSQYVEYRDLIRIVSLPGELGKAFGPFDPGTRGQLNDSMKLNLSMQNLKHRQSLLRSLDSMRRNIDRSGNMEAMDKFRQQAFEVILGGDVRKALDLSREPEKIRAAYDTGHFKVGWTKKRPSTLGGRLLMARRLCQAGCGFVTVGSAGWDNHANGKHPNVKDGMALLGRPLDHAVSAFLDDVEQQGLSEKILLVILSEFGRTPRIGKNGGRDHWPGLCPLVFSGGGLKTGQVIGESTSKAEKPKSDPLRFEDLLGTLWGTLFDVGQLRLVPGLPRELLNEVEKGRMIRQLG